MQQIFYDAAQPPEWKWSVSCWFHNNKAFSQQHGLHSHPLQMHMYTNMCTGDSKRRHSVNQSFDLLLRNPPWPFPVNSGDIKHKLKPAAPWHLSILHQLEPAALLEFQHIDWIHSQTNKHAHEHACALVFVQQLQQPEEMQFILITSVYPTAMLPWVSGRNYWF